MAVELGNEVNAVFYVALVLVGFVWIVPQHLSSALFAVNAHDRSTLHAELRSVWRSCAVFSGVAAVLASVLATPLLATFGPGYTEATGTLVLLALASPAAAVKSVYIAIWRAWGRMDRAVIGTGLGAGAELVLAQVGLSVTGTTEGVAAGVALAMTLEAACFWPLVRRTMAASR